MRAVTIDLARGADQSIDPRVAPQGTVARAQDCRIDRLGRLVARRGYTSLGTTVSHGVGPLVPFDLYSLGDDLVCAGNSSPGQTGIRALYRYTNQVAAIWRTEQHDPATGNTEADFIALPAADTIRVVLSDPVAQETDVAVADCAALSDGTAVCMVSTTSALPNWKATVVNPTTGRVIKTASVAGSNPRVLAIGTVFYLFYQTGTTVEVRTLTSTTQAAVSGATVIATGTSAAPLAYDVANEGGGSTDYLIAYPTGTGYTWRRFNSANVQQTTTNVASLAAAPVSICGSSAQGISVLNVRAASGAEIRTFTQSTGVLAVGPTNLDTTGTVMDWVGLSQFNNTNSVYYTFHRTATNVRVFKGQVNTATHAQTAEPDHFNTRPATKPITIDGEVFHWETLGNASPAPYGLTFLGSDAGTRYEFLSGIVLDGAAKVIYSSETIGYKSQITRGLGAACFVALVAFDPRDKTYRAQLVSFNINSGQRRQGVQIGNSLAIAGGVVHQYDARTSVEVGFESAPVIESLVDAGAGGALTLLGTYTYQLVYRCVAANGDVTQSAPSAPRSVTLAGASTTTSMVLSNTYSCRRHRINQAQGMAVFVDVYRTEAGGSIPRLVISRDVSLVITGYGQTVTIGDGVSDAIQQTGAALYTQGADGSVSGRLPLGLASPGTLLAESDGKLIVGGLERDNQAHISTESRPGEAIGFVNDDLFFIQNIETLTAIIGGDGGRRYLFGRNNIRELVGPGPNAAGVGDISEPVEIENRVGASDWRSVCKTEHGVFFLSTGRALASDRGSPRIYLLPSSGGGAIDASQGITDLLELFPVVTSATRHDEEQLLTFALQNAAGTDGRVIHLDLKTSGLSKNGWVGRWLVDRVQALEAPPLIEIVEETIRVFPFVSFNTSIAIPLPTGKRIGDRLLLVVNAQGASNTLTTPTSYTQIANIDSSAGTLYVFERLLTTTAGAQSASATTVFAGSGASSAIVVKTWLLRGAHGSQAAELVSVVNASGTSLAIPTLTPSWGATNTLWLSLAMSDTALGTIQGMKFPFWRGMPTSFERFAFENTTEGGLAAASLDVASASRQLNAASLGSVTWTGASSSSAIGLLIGVRPLANTGTPVRASTQYRGRLVLCNSTDVLHSDPSANGDLGATFVSPELELADIYPMGVGGEGRHLRIGLLVEILGACLVTALCSYDNGANWTALRAHSLDGVSGYQIGQTVRLQWTPTRRKIQGVRVKFTVSEAFALASGPTGGAAMLQAQLFFEDLAGPSRATAASRGVLAT